MDIDEAKEKFGNVVLNKYNNAIWEPDPKRIRGLVLSFAQDVDNVFMVGEVHEAEDYIDHFWSWAEKALGDGFNAVFFSAEGCDSNSFRRVTKDEIVEYANKLYIVNDDYKSNIDSKSVVVPDRYRIAYDNMCWWALFEEKDPVERVEYFREIESGGGGTLPADGEGHIKENYIYSTKRLALELCDSEIPYSDIELGNLADEWIRVMTEELGHTHGSLFHGGKPTYMTYLPTESKYRSWIRSEFEDNFEFEEAFNRFSNRLSSEDTQRTLEPIDRPDLGSDDELEGQVSIGDFSDGGDSDE